MKGFAGGDVVNSLDQYSPFRPVPWPTEELLMNPALATPLLTEPGFAAIACTPALLVRVKGLVYRIEFVVGVVPSSV